MLKRQKSNQERITYLAEEIKRHRYLYYNEQPEISDTKYDTLEDELRELDPENPILFKIGVDSSELFTKREHIIPMTSQDKVTYPQEFLKWARKRNFKTFIVQFKLDGISIEYDKWWFNVRPSNTEPLLRLNLEAKSKHLMKKKTKEILKVIRK